MAAKENLEPASPPIGGFCAPGFERVREAFATNLAEADLGAGVSAWVDGQLVVNLWGGYREETRKTPWTEDTLVLVASCTKAFTAVCLLQLIETGQVELDAPVCEYWPEFAAAGKEAVTIRHILTHQAGLPGLREPFTYDDIFGWTPVIRLLERAAPHWRPGARHGYHPILFGFLIGEVVRRVSGMKFGAYLQKNVCEPLGLDFYVGVPEAEHRRIAEISYASPEVLPPTPEFQALLDRASVPGSITQLAFGNPPAPPGITSAPQFYLAEMPAGNGHGTALAMAKFYMALGRGGALNGVRILSEEMLARAVEQEVFGVDATIGAPSRFGLGFMLRHDLFPIGPDARAFGHPGAGGNLGFADPERKLGFGYVMNRGKLSMFGSKTAYRLVDAIYACL